MFGIRDDGSNVILRSLSVSRWPTIVIGQCPYPSSILPALGAAFSQVSSSQDTPTVDVFSRHFDNSKEAKEFIRSTWKMLSSGIAFVNADYYPSSTGGGSGNVGLVLRVNNMVEFLLYVVVSRVRPVLKIKLMCSGNVAMSCGSTLSRRLRSIGIRVDQMNFRQPAFLDKISYNRHLIGKDDR